MNLPVVVVSPHLDDAVLSAGQFLAGRADVIVVTVCAGTPADTTPTAYDRKCGFTDAHDATATRRDEDKLALAMLAATPVHLGFLDSQYGGTLDVDAVNAAIAEQITAFEPEFIVGPLGLIHPDHRAVRNAVLAATREHTRPVWLYEELPYRVVEPLSVLPALDEIDGNVALGFIGTGSLATKMGALWAYRSQMALPEFENTHNLLVPERFWSVHCR